MKSLDKIIIKNQIVLFRADLNVPVQNGRIIDYSRINAIIPSINNLSKNNNKIFIITHFGRPMGKVKKKYSINFLCDDLQRILNKNKIHFLETLENKKINNKIKEMDGGDICLCENIRFYPEEEINDLNFSKNISLNFDYFINDAFSASHRKHSSIVGFPNFLPSIAGISFVKEINNLDQFLNKAKKPNIAIIGGSKISTKIKIIYNLLDFFDTIVIGGAMANTFLLSNNYKIGKSLVEKDYINVASDIIKIAGEKKCEIILPTDVVCSTSFEEKHNVRTCKINDVFEDHMILDIGEATTELIIDKILKSKSVLWNGPLGAFEYKPFDKSSLSVANAIHKYSNDFKIDTMAGGGDTISVINLSNTSNSFTYLSNAGGAFLEWLEGNKSPGYIALQENIK